MKTPTIRLPVLAFLVLVLGFMDSNPAQASDLSLDDHSQRPWYDAPRSAFDYGSFARIIVVTGTPNWPYNNVNLTNVRICDAQGVPIMASINIPQGTPLGTVVGTTTVLDGSPGQFDAIGHPTAMVGPPHHIETYYGDPHPYVGDAVGEPWTFHYTKSGDGGYNGCDPVCGREIDSGGDHIWTVYAGPRPPSNPEVMQCSTKTAGNQTNCSSCNSNSPADSFAMARYSIHAMLVSLNIQDTPLRYSPAYGPAVDFTVTYNQRESEQPATFTYSNLGPKWTFGWLSYVTDDPNHQFLFTALYRSGGGTEVFAYDDASQSFVIDPRSHAALVKTAAGYERRLPDGSKEVFALSDGATSYPRRIFMTQLVDAVGNTVNIGYDTNFRVTTITDATGLSTHISYELQGDARKITKVTDPFGRFATFDYTNGQLTRITDEIGIQSQFTYTAGTDSIDTLTTPYGTTSFVTGENGTNRWIEATDPLGGKERVEYRDQAPGIPASDAAVPSATGVVNAGLDRANTFYWDKKAMLVAPGDYTQAKITHWLLKSDGTPADAISSEKKPLENRVWYTYAGQADYLHVGTSANPLQIARALADGSTQLNQFEYNSIGKTTKTTDPVGRVMSYVYDTNNIDLLEIRQTRGTNNELQRKFTYDPVHQPPHLPVSEKDAAGQPTTYTYNAHGQLLTRTNAKNEQTTYTYGGTAPAGHLESVTSPAFNGNSAVTSFGYDVFNRVRTVTNVADNYTTTTDYDNLDRKVKVTYPDTTYEEFRYTVDTPQGPKMTLDLTGNGDRRGLWTYRHYDANQHMDSITDPENRTTLYGWCTCGSLTSITDPNGNVTTFNRDIQSRVYEKVFQDTTKITYLYDGQTAPNTAGATSRLQSSTDARNQQTNYLYYPDDNLQQVSYANALLPTPTVGYVYDPNYNRVTSMSDGIGTTNYTYYPVADGILGAGKLHTTSGPLPNSTITLGYDELGRVVGQDINGTPASVTYDSLGRVSTTDNALGSFSRIYDGVTPRLLTLNYPNGQNSSYSYFDNLHDRRLQTIQNATATSTNLSRHDYTYDATGEIQTWNKTLGATETDLSFGYDSADQLVSVSQPGVRFNYLYDAAGNRLSNTFSARHIHGGDGYTANNLNQLDSVARYSGIGPSYGAVPITYDANGNMTDDGGNRTFEWDAANRLVAINYKDAGRTEFAYDGLGRRVKILEYDGSSAATIEPGSGEYETFTAGPFTVPAGSYTLLFQGVNAHQMMLLDAVTLNDAPVTDGSFESPAVVDYQYRPNGTAWTFGNSVGIAANSGTFTGGSADAPDGTQAAFIEGSGSLWQTFTLPAGDYTFTFQAAQAINVNDGSQQLDPPIGGDAFVFPAAELVGVKGGNSQQVRVTLLGLPTSTKTFVWSGNTIAEERDATGAIVTKRFFAEGEQRIGGDDAGNYYYSRDHLGSVREVTDASGALKAQYDYDAWGNQVVVTGNMSFDFGYTGHYRHAASNLYLAPYRAYDPAIGRWLNRDPLKNAELKQGPNLYGYVGNDPSNKIDPNGKNAIAIGAGIGTIFGPEGTVIGAGIGVIVTVIGGAAVYDYVHNKPVACKKPRERDEECEQRCYEAYEEHCKEYCAQLASPYQRMRCFERAMITHNICVENCYK